VGDGAAQRVRAWRGAGDHVDGEAGPHQGHYTLPQGHEAGLPLALHVEFDPLPPIF